MTNQSQLYDLLDKYVRKEHTEEEKNELFSLLAAADNDELTKQWIDEAFHRNYDPVLMDKAVEDDMIRVILEQGNVKPIRQSSRVYRLWIRYAAASIIVIAAGWLFLKNQRAAKTPDIVQVPTQQEPAPGTTKPILTLGNGKQLTLDDKAKDALAHRGISTGESMIQYSGSGEMEMNTIATPRGGQYQIILSDGTRVWMNAASSITFPTAFTKNSRQVSMTGEVYFEVAKDSTKPFQVLVNNESKIEVLGTHFNVNAYSDEPVTTTTLLEGSIRMNTTVIRPGESFAGGRVTKADIISVMAWKNGYFQLKGANVEVLMRQISRWYDVDVSFEGPIAERQFAGQLQRSLKLSEALQILEESNVHFRREGKKLIVTNSK